MIYKNEDGTVTNNDKALGALLVVMIIFIMSVMSANT